MSPGAGNSASTRGGGESGRARYPEGIVPVNPVHITLSASFHQQPVGLEDLTRSHIPPSPGEMGERALLDLQVRFPLAGILPHLDSSRPTKTQSPRSSRESRLPRMGRRLRPANRWRKADCRVSWSRASARRNEARPTSHQHNVGLPR
jgi:hypothetical protein